MYVLGEVDHTFLEEAWILYGIGMFVLVVRCVVRLKTVGLRGLQGDDFFTVLVIGFYTVDAVTVHNVYYMGSNVEGAAIQQSRELLPGEISQLIEGSKQQFVAWYSYASLVWCLKGTMVCFFKRMTMGLSQAKWINWLAGACILSYIAVFFTITFGCFPTHKNWQVVPDPGMTCTLKTQNFIVMTVLNVLTDAAILAIPLPLLWTLRIPMRQKIVIGILLSSGLFVISAAIIRIVSTLAASPSALTVNRWGVRETIVGIIAVNVPILRPLFTRNFWRPQTKVSSSSGQGLSGKSGSRPAHGPYTMTHSVNGSSTDVKATRASFHGSEDHIIGDDIELASHKKTNAGVVVETTYEITSEQRNDIQPWHERGLTETNIYKNSP